MHLIKQIITVIKTPTCFGTGAETCRSFTNSCELYFLKCLCWWMCWLPPLPSVSKAPNLFSAKASVMHSLKRTQLRRARSVEFRSPTEYHKLVTKRPKVQGSEKWRVKCSGVKWSEVKWSEVKWSEVKWSWGGSSPLCFKYIIRVTIDSQNTNSICWFFYLFVRVTTCFGPSV